MFPLVPVTGLALRICVVPPPLAIWPLRMIFDVLVLMICTSVGAEVVDPVLYLNWVGLYGLT